MKRILRASALAGCFVVAGWMATSAPAPHSLAYAQGTLMRSQTVVYYNGYGQVYYGGYVPSYGGTYVFVPNNGYSGYGNGPYGNYPGYGNPGYYQPYYGRTLGPPSYRATPFGNYYRGF